MMNYEEIENIKDAKEVFDELSSIEEYLKDISMKGYYNSNAQDFIDRTINKYRYKVEVFNFYMRNGSDDTSMNQYDTLMILKRMIRQYASIKFGESFLPKEKSKL